MVNRAYFEMIYEMHGEDKLNEIINNVKSVQSIDNLTAVGSKPYVYLFISKLLELFRVKSVFDPFAIISSPCLIIPNLNPSGYCRSNLDHESITNVFPEYRNTFFLKDLLYSQYEETIDCDFVLSFPPFALRIPQSISDFKQMDYTISLIVNCLDVIKENGRMLFLVAPSFFFKDREKETIKQLGLNVEAVFSLKSNAISPWTNIASYLVLLSKRPIKSTFVCELSEDKDSNQIILENFREGRNGRFLQLGYFTEFERFRSIRALSDVIEIDKASQKFGFAPTRLIDISTKIDLLKEERADLVTHFPNTIYLPKIGNSPVVCNTSSMHIKPRNYYRIQLDESKANALYVANFLNTELGRKIRSSMEIGSTIMQIPKSELINCKVFLPDIPKQSTILDLNSKIEETSIKLDEIKRKLWKEPGSSMALSKELLSINREEKLVDWIDILPFPISSILWLYYTNKEPEKRLEHLFHFFEAFSEFLSMIILSALIQDKEFYKKECHKWVTTDEKFKEWYLRATFGSWNVLLGKLSKAVREHLSDEERKENCRILFGNPDNSFLNIIQSKGLIRILNDVCDLRNSWKGHGGVMDEAESIRRSKTLEIQLHELRRIMADGFENVKIITPGKSSFEDGVFSYNTKELVGARIPFNETMVQSIIPLDRKKLYLSHAYQVKPIELLPFIKYVEKTNAIYFYMSIESKNVRWVSYHFDKESELKQPADDELFKAFDFLKA